ncbi:hypothetical protein [Candidatus Contubernalis alkaliaceticus]|uniref:hypothetical protein n=1 Tax=Candidatus Contubernalis alkaliaceticus TaxID=338645 RepID=UPI001F4BD778|nr:hypothetical protein [Candidatus Contubernalis alkalaceticus]UNC93508.1 hypothetical protein HUE98_16340 [Candidatus Contubernalis alkalaceticus]
MKPVKINSQEILEAINSGNGYIQVDGREFLLLEVEKIDDASIYEVTDLEEEKQLLQALNKNNPILSDKEIDSMLGK